MDSTMKLLLTMVLVSLANGLRSPFKQAPKTAPRKAVSGPDFQFTAPALPTPPSFVEVWRSLPGTGTPYGRPSFEPAKDVPRTSPFPELVALAIVAVTPLLPILTAASIFTYAPGNQLPFNFLDKLYPPRVAELKRESNERDRIAAEAKAKAEAIKKQQQEAEAKAKSAEDAKAKAEAEAKAKAEMAKAPANNVVASPKPSSPAPAPQRSPPKAVKTNVPKVTPVKTNAPNPTPVRTNAPQAAPRRPSPTQSTVKKPVAVKKPAVDADKELTLDEARDILKKYTKSGSAKALLP